MKKILLIIFLLCAVNILKSQNVMSDQTVFENYIMYINAHDVEGMYAITGSNYVFINSEGKKIVNVEEDKLETIKFFKMFPDFKITINKSFHEGITFFIEGTAEGTYGGLRNASGDNYFNIPGAWKAEVENGKVRLWQSFVNTKSADDIIKKYSSGGTDSKLYDDDTKVTGFGGVFLKSKDAKALCEWYNKNLGTNFGKEQYMSFEWSERGNANSKASTTFGIFSEKTKYFDPSTKEVMLNFRVKDLNKLLDKLKSEGVTIVGEPQDYDYGKFGWIMDIDGNKIELWEPKDEVLDQYEKSK